MVISRFIGRGWQVAVTGCVLVANLCLAPTTLVGQPFSLVFVGPARFVLPQQTYRVEHDSLGELDLFLVPIGPNGGGMRYEAVFT